MQINGLLWSDPRRAREYIGSTPQAHSKQLANDVRTWAKWVKDAGVRVD